MAAKKDVFVISPIGKPGTAVRKHADKVFDNIIRPALSIVEASAPESAPIRFNEPDRGDRIDTQDKGIMEQVLRKLRHADLTIALLTFDRHNVFYELGIADCVGRPLVLLRKRTREAPPFDIAHRRIVDYMSPDDVTAPANLANAIRNALNSPDRYAGPFSERIDAFGPHNLSLSMYEEFARGLPYSEYSQIFQKAKDFIWIAGTSMRDFSQPDVQPFDYAVRGAQRKVSFPQLVYMKLAQGVDVRVYMMDDDNHALEQMIIRSGDPTMDALSIEKVRDEIRSSARMWGLIQQESAKISGELREGEKLGRLSIVKIKHGILYNRVTLTDQEALVTPNYYTLTRNGHGPSMRGLCNTNLWRATRSDLSYLAERNTPSDRPAQPAEASA